MLDLSTILVILAGAFLVYMFANQMGVSAVQNEGTVSVAPQGDSSDTPAYIPQMDVQAPSGGVEAGSDDPFAYPIPGNPADFTGAGVDRVNWDGLGENQLAGALSKQYQELSGDDLLPHNDIAHWADVYPNGVGQLSGKNFLHSGHFVGINTVGQSLKNANLQLRSEPANPQVAHSIFLQSSYGPDLLRRPLEVGSNCN
jgi:hypothetical protein